MPTSGSTTLYEIRGVPTFQNRTYGSPEAACNCPKGDVVLVQDPQSGLVYNGAFNPELMDYGPEYQNEQALSGAFRKHLEDVTGVVTRHLQGRSIIEVGCGKGYFLEWLAERGFDVVGMDPAYEGENSRIVKEYFRPGGGRRADGIVLRHVLEHVSRPFDFLSTIRDANGGAGIVYIEVPGFDWICERRAWFDVFYEHVNYFRPIDFQRMFGKVLEAGRLFGDQYIYVVADLSSLRKPVAQPSDLVRFPADFLDRVSAQAALVKASSGRGAAVWGGASKGVIFTLMMQRAGAPVDLVVDINPAKQGRYLPVTGAKVVSAEEATASLPPGANVFVMNGNYLDEIREITGDRYAYIPVDAVPNA